VALLGAHRPDQPARRARLPRQAQPPVPARRPQPVLPHRIRLRHGHRQVAADGAALDKKYGGYLAQYLAAGFATRQVGNTYNVIANGLEQAMTLSILVVGALLVMQNDGFTVGMLVAFQMFAGRMSQPMLRLVGLWQEFQQANIAVKRLGDILTPRRTACPHPSANAGRPGASTSSRLAFRYSEQHPWLYRNLDLTLKPGHLTCSWAPPAAARARWPSCCSASTRPGRPDPPRRQATSATSPPTNCASLRRRAAGDRALLRHALRQPAHGPPARQLRGRHRRLQGSPRSTT
jgi:hypothetical protein